MNNPQLPPPPTIQEQAKCAAAARAEGDLNPPAEPAVPTDLQKLEAKIKELEDKLKEKETKKTEPTKPAAPIIQPALVKPPVIQPAPVPPTGTVPPPGPR